MAVCNLRSGENLIFLRVLSESHPESGTLEIGWGNTSSEWHGLLRFQRSDVDGKAILHIGLDQSFAGFGDLLDRDGFFRIIHRE